MTVAKKTLLLIDAHALIHRAYHALPPLTTREGAVVHAVYGFTSVLLKVLSDLKPEYIAAAFDLPEPTFRDELYDDYKAHRPSTPEDLIEQIPLVRELLDSFGIPIVEKAGFEADDIIGTIAEQFRYKKNISTVIVTGDLDTLQLVGDNVSVYTLRRGMQDTTMYKVKEVEKRYGVSPKDLPDHKGLMGDPSDNIPGVPGIGQKTATILLQEFGSMDAIYEALEKDPDDKRIKPRARKNLIEHKNDALLSRELGTIRCDAGVTLTLKDAEQKSFNREKVALFLRRLGFTSLLKRLPGTPKQSIKKLLDQSIITTAKELVEIFNGGSLGIFPEWEASEGRQTLHGLRIEKRDGSSVILRPSGKWSPSLSVISRYAGRVVVHDGKPLWKILLREGTAPPKLVHDTMLAAYLEHPQDGQHSVRDLLMADDVATIVELAERQHQRLSVDGLLSLFEDVESPLTVLLATMELNGISVDVKYLKAVGVKARKHLAGLEKRIYKEAKGQFTINSPKQLSEVLFERLGISANGLKKTSTGMISTAESELTKIRDVHPLIPLVLEYRTFAKAISTYIEPLPEAVDSKTKRIHTTFHQTVTATGRLSSSDPNLQNIPVKGELANEIRSAFIPAPGRLFLSFDYSQIELRVAAVISNDTAMLDAFSRGEDIHARTAAEIFGVKQEKVSKDQRRLAKVLNFGVLFGMSSHGFSRASGVSREEAQGFIDRYMKEFSGIASYIKETEKSARAKGFVRTLLGRRRPIPEITSSNFQVREAARRMAINMPIQGTAADLLKIAMLRVDDSLMSEGLDKETDLLLQIHDELLFEIHPQNKAKIANLVRDTMESVRTDALLVSHGVTFPIPLDVDVSVGDSWGSFKLL